MLFLVCGSSGSPHINITSEACSGFFGSSIFVESRNHVFTFEEVLEIVVKLEVLLSVMSLSPTLVTSTFQAHSIPSGMFPPWSHEPPGSKPPEIS